MSLIVQLLRAGERPETFFAGDDGVLLDEDANFVLPPGEEIIASFDVRELMQTSRTTTGAPHISPDMLHVYEWTLSLTPGRILIKSPYSVGTFGSARRVKGVATAGYLRYEDMAGLSAVNFTDKKKREGRIEILSRGNTGKGGMEITTIVRSDSADVLSEFARVLTEQLRARWRGREDDADAFERRLREFAGLDWRAVIDEPGYLKGLGVYQYEDGRVGAQWREELPLPPSGADALKRTANELKEDAKRTAAFLTGRTYKTPEKPRYRGEE
jgi:hypothetical protein